VRLPSWGLTAFTYAGDQGAGWAVGDHGAIVALDPAPAQSQQAPKLGSRTASELSDGSAYQALQPPPSAVPGVVPALSSQPLQTLDRPAAIPGGTPDWSRPVNAWEETPTTIVMSRDGSEGWALGSGNAYPNAGVNDIPLLREPDYVGGGSPSGGAPAATTTLYHFNGQTWVRCDSDGVPGVLSADPACASLASIRSLDFGVDPNGHALHGVKIMAAARVPLEQSSDPSHANDFEVVAVGEAYPDPSFPGDPTVPLVLRYEHGRWSLWREAMAQLAPANNTYLAAVAFTAPDDGWIVGSFGSIHHYDGHRWMSCSFNGSNLHDVVDPQACGDPTQRLAALMSNSNHPPLYITAAGDRVYLYGYRISYVTSTPSTGNDLVDQALSLPLNVVGQETAQDKVTPLILVHRRDGTWSSERSAGGLDPATDDPTSPSSGYVTGLSVVHDPDGSYKGWAVGEFGQTAADGPLGTHVVDRAGAGLMRLDDQTGWQPWTAEDASHDYLPPPDRTITNRAVVLTLPGGEALVERRGAPLLRFDPTQDRWVIQPTPFPTADYAGKLVVDSTSAPFELMPATPMPWHFWGNDDNSLIAPDGHGGAWVAVRGLDGSHFQFSFYDVTRSAHRAIFSDISHPIREAITSLAGAPDGQLWIATQAGVVYHYDRLLGWERVKIPGWDPGANTTAPSSVWAVAVNAAGVGVAVGKAGRVADLSPQGVQLDPAAGVVCGSNGADPPCGTAEDLRAAAVAPDGSALVGGDAHALLWRQGTGPFRLVDSLPPGPHTTITGVSMPTPDRAWIVDTRGQVLAGQLQSGQWHWHQEAVTVSGEPLSVVENDDGMDKRDDHKQLAADGWTPPPLDGKGNELMPLRAIAIDAGGHGFAVGDRGVALERSPDGSWQRLRADSNDSFYSVALPAGGGPGALIGGQNGTILTLVGDHLEIANQADPWNGVSAHTYIHPGGAGRVVGLALLPGTRPGEIEAWAALRLPNTLDDSAWPAIENRTPSPQALLHYASDASDPLLNPATRAEPLPDSPPPAPDEISFAAFGKSDCALGVSNAPCPPISGSNFANELIATRVRDAIIASAHAPGGPQFALVTGDVNDSAGHVSAAGENAGAAGPLGLKDHTVPWPTDPSANHKAWWDVIGQPQAAAGVPVLSAIGGQDLSYSVDYTELPLLLAKPGERQQEVASNFGWRQAFASMAAPWGAPGSSAAPPAHANGLTYCPLPDGQTSIATDDLAVPGQGSVSGATLPTGGARTHYALDLIRGDCRGGPRIARLVTVDTSLKSMQASDPLQQPHEAGGQSAWLQSVLCTTGSVSDASHTCTRGPHEPAIVLTNTPTYSYGPGQNETQSPSDAVPLESLLIANHATLVVSGRIGWNALYYALAPGVHYPCPGGEYPAVPPTSAGGCAPVGGVSASAASAAVGGLAAGLQGTSPPAAGQGPAPVTQPSALPFVVASSAGGKFTADQSGGAVNGFWHGYTQVRIEPDGQVVVEQRPVLDWIGVSAIAHDLQPGQHLQLHGFGREPVGIDQPVQYDDIVSPAITHRYDLVEADAAAPYLPKIDPGSASPNHYVPLDPSLATVNPVTGFVQTGAGSHPRVYAIAILSVGDKAATWPIVFEPRRSFTQRTSIRPQIPPALPPVQSPPVHVAAAAPTPPPPPGGAPPTPPEVGTPSLPQLPSLAAPPPVAAVPGPSAPPPPAPPPPPPSQPQPLPLALEAKLSPAGINATVVPPTPPPVNPAPPSGSAARKEAKQRQAATAKSEEGSAGEQTQAAGGDLAEGPLGPTGSAMTRRDPSSLAMVRRDRGRPFGSITGLARHHQRSAWVQDLVYGGCIGITALVLMLAFVTVRAGPRRREPRLAVPAWARERRW
jgi:hypothetical protein